MNAWAISEGQPGLAYIFFANDNGATVGRGPVANNVGPEKTESLRNQLGLKDLFPKTNPLICLCRISKCIRQ
jgi:aspartyl-tRNA synthetase